MASVIGVRGQVTLEKELREELGIGPGWRVAQRRVGDRIELRFLPPRHQRSLRGVLADPHGPSFPTEAALNAAKEQAWAEAMREQEQGRGAPAFDGPSGVGSASAEPEGEASS
jgi:bifunctional DNA-binding transcriptional regulator/antitoxin component of YhaV-PrlF toxin-antitoxin module